MSLCGGLFKKLPETLAVSVSLSLNPCWFLQPEIMGTYFPGTGILAWGSYVGLGPLDFEISLLFLSGTCGCETTWSTSLPLIPVLICFLL